jgi:hypothetical protein
MFIFSVYLKYISIYVDGFWVVEMISSAREQRLEPNVNATDVKKEEF